MENLFASAEIHSSNFSDELQKLTGATPSYKVFILPDSFKVDLKSEWDLGTFNNVVSGTLGTFGTNGNIKLTVVGTYITGTIYGGTSADIIPTMSSFNSSTGTLTESGHLGVNTYEGWRAFDDNNTTQADSWVSAITSGWLNFKFGTSQKVIQYTITSREDGPLPRPPKSWIFEASNDGTTYTSLHIGTNVVDWATVSNLTHKYSFVNGTSYANYRINISHSCDTSFVGIGEMELMINVSSGTDGTEYGTQLATIGTYASKIYDSKLYNNYKWLGFNEIKNAGTTQYQFRTGSNITDCDSATWKTVSSGTRPQIQDNEFYQFRTILSGDGTTTPVVDSISGTYIYNPTDDPLVGLIEVGGISRNLERLFQQTEISSISPTFNNVLGFLTPGGTGLYGTAIAKGIYNDKIEVWKGFKYGWTGSTWGTAEYIPAFTGYIDNISANNESGKAVLSARDKGKLFKNNTSEKCTTTGTAGGAYWSNELLSDDVEHLLLQSVNYGTRNTDYQIDKSVIVDSAGSYHFVTNEFQQIGTNVTGNAMTFLNGTLFFVDYRKVYSYIPQGTAKFEWDLNEQGWNLINDGTRVYSIDNARTMKWENGTVTDLSLLTGVNWSLGGNAVYYNNYIYFGTVKNAGTKLLNKYNVLTGSYGTCNNDVLLNISNFGLDDVNGKLLVIYDNKLGTYGAFHYDLTSEVGTKILTVPGYTINIDVAYGIQNHIKYNEYLNSYGIITYAVATGTVQQNYCGWINSAGGRDNVSQSGVNELFTAIEPSATNTWYAVTSMWGTADIPARLFESGTLTIGTLGTINPKMHQIYGGLAFAPSYYSNGTIQSRLYIKGLVLDVPFSRGTTYLAQYSPEYNLAIGTFIVGQGDYVADVLQELAEASNYIQYIDEGGKYYFKRRDSGTTINHNFIEADIVNTSLIEGDSVSESPIINKGVWGTNTGTVSYEDLASQGTYGIQSYQLQNKWITTPSVANDILYGMTQYFSLPKKIVTAKLRYYPTVKLFDVFTLTDSRLGLNNTKKWQCIGYSEDPENTEITGKEI